jgi:RimJ/RimL family protein N-acetyltransferase
MEVFSPITGETRNAEASEELNSLHRGMQARALAESVVEQLLHSGYPPGEIVTFASEALRALNGHLSKSGAGEGREERSANAQQTKEREIVRYSVTGARSVEGGGESRVCGSRVYLRQATLDDVGILTGWKEEPTIRATFSVRTLTAVIADLESRDENAEKQDFIICLGSGDPIGLVSLQDIDESVGQAEMTKLIGEESARGHGYAYEATLLLLAFAFDVLKLQRIAIRTAGVNMRNIRLNEQIGFRYEGLQRRAIRIDGELSNVVLMGILDSDFRDRYSVCPL